MCLRVRFQSRTSYYEEKKGEAARRVKKTAIEDIHVVKILCLRKSKLLSPFTNFEFIQGKVYKAKFSYGDLDVWQLEEEDIREKNSNEYENILEIEAGLHSCQDLKRAKRYKNYCVYEGFYYNATIPKGSTYFENDGLLCSDKLIIGDRIVRKK